MLLNRTFRLLQSAVLQYGSNRWASNHYETLGITQKATQTEIKTAYYEKSKQYHPDRNQDEESVEKFRQITQAYEVLGNYRLRRLYDKGVIHSSAETYGAAAADDEPIVEDDPQTKFYKSRFHKSKVVDSTRQEPIYDFDEWSKAHYGKSFDRRKTAKAKFDYKADEKKRHITSVENERVIAAMMALLVLMYSFFFMESKHDTPKVRDTSADAQRKRVE